MIVAGILVALLGLAIGRFAFPQTNVELEARVATQETRIVELTRSVEDMTARLGSLAEASAVAALGDEVATLTGRSDEATTALAAIADQLGTLSDRVEVLALRPTTVAPDTEALDAELERFQQQLTAAIDAATQQIGVAQAEAQSVEAAAEEARRAAEARAALSEMRAAIDAGTAFVPAIDTLEDVTDVPAELSQAASAGVATLAQLQGDFAPAARRAIDAAIRADVSTSSSFVERANAFLRAQTGVRSLAPREGEDADAILSRAEAALRAGDLAEAVAQIDGLPAAAAAPISDWRAAAQARLDALAATDALDNQLNSN